MTCQVNKWTSTISEMTEQVVKINAEIVLD